jgi:RNA polymerase sigma-70 factor (ECF subfamily)
MDKDALFREVLESERHGIYRICCCYLRDREDRNDAFQEALLRIYQRLESFRGNSALKTWLYRITANTCLDFLRSRQRREKPLDRNANLDDRLGGGAVGEEGLDDAMDVDRMYACIQRLPVVERTLVSLYLEEMSTKEIAEVMGISEANVRVKMTRVRGTLRRMLEVTKHGAR